MKGIKHLQRAMTIPCSSFQNEQNGDIKNFLTLFEFALIQTKPKFFFVN